MLTPLAVRQPRLAAAASSGVSFGRPIMSNTRSGRRDCSQPKSIGIASPLLESQGRRIDDRPLGHADSSSATSTAGKRLNTLALSSALFAGLRTVMRMRTPG